MAFDAQVDVDQGRNGRVQVFDGDRWVVTVDFVDGAVQGWEPLDADSEAMEYAKRRFLEASP